MKALQGFPEITDQRLLVSSATGDDAAVFKQDDGKLIVQTLDFFTPVVDDPYLFGQIAAANAISDVYAMGATPIFGLNIVAFPMKQLGHEVLREILRGGNDKAREAGFFVAGGHSIDDAEPKYGMVVTGLCDEADLLTNAGAKVGDVLVMTKPLGVGIMTTAIKSDAITEAELAPAIESMAALNKPGGEAAQAVGAHAATDITGFGLIGHLSGMAKASGTTMEIDFNSLPVFEKAIELAKQDIAPGGTRKNLKHYGGDVAFADIIEDWQKLIFSDAQTSGGMIIAVAADKADALVAALKERNALSALIVGRVLASNGKHVRVN